MKFALPTACRSFVYTTMAKAGRRATAIRRATARSATCSAKDGLSKVRCSAVCLDELSESLVNRRIGREHFATRGEPSGAGISSDAAAGFFDQQQTCRSVPRMHMRLVETIETAGRNVREHQCARAGILHRGAAGKERAAQREMRFEIVTMHVALRDQSIVERCARG